jgi:molybdopterin synthase sulfur carrier subunit
MVKVTLTGNLAQLAGGVTELELDAKDIRQLLRGLAAQFPSLGPHLEEGIAVAINGEIFQDTWFEPIPDGADVHILPAIGGG